MDNANRALMVRSLNWQLTKAVDYSLFHCDQVNVRISWGAERSDPPRIRILDREVDDLGKALEYLDHLLANVRCVRILSLNVEISDTHAINAIIEKFLDAGKQ